MTSPFLQLQDSAEWPIGHNYWKSKSILTSNVIIPNFWKLGRYSPMCEFCLQWMIYKLRWFNISTISVHWNQVMAIVTMTSRPEWEWPQNNARYGTDLERPWNKQRAEMELYYRTSALVCEDGSHLDPLQRRRMDSDESWREKDRTSRIVDYESVGLRAPYRPKYFDSWIPPDR